MTSGSRLLAAGAVADVVGSRPVFLTGCFLLACFVLECGLARTGIELIILHAMQGIAVALCLPTSVGILTNAVARGKRLDMGFACIGLGQPLGFSLGLVLKEKAAAITNRILSYPASQEGFFAPGSL